LTPRRPPALLAAIVVAALLAGCAGGDDGTDGAAQRSSTTAPTTATTEVAAANTVAIGMRDYGFDVGGPLVAGTGSVAFRNDGREVHMAGFGLLRDDKTVDDVIEALASEDGAAFEQVFEKELDAPGGLLGPGEAMEVTTPFLEAGTYAVMCFVPTAGEDLPHSAKGMVAELEVTEGDARPPAPSPAATYTIAANTVTGPAALPAGRTTLEVRSGAGGPHEVLVIRKKSPTTTYAEIDAAYTSLFEGEVPPAANYPDTLPAALAGNVFDVPADTTIFVTLDLAPGDYLVGCARRPDDGPEHTGELLEVKVG
jgi:hypothetical protein